MQTSQLIYLHSRDGTTHGAERCTVHYMGGAQILRQRGTHLGMQVESLVVNQGFYNSVRVGVTDKLVGAVLDGEDVLETATLTLTAGDYTIPLLIAEIQEQWAAAFVEANVVLTYRRVTKRLSIVSDTVGRTVRLTLQGSTAAELIGLTADTDAATVATELGRVANVNSISMLQVHSSLSVRSFDSHEGDLGTVIISVPVDKMGSILTYRAGGVALQPLHVDHISVIALWLTDEQGRVVDNDDLNWSITLRIVTSAPARVRAPVLEAQRRLPYPSERRSSDESKRDGVLQLDAKAGEGDSEAVHAEGGVR